MIMALEKFQKCHNLVIIIMCTLARWFIGRRLVLLREKTLSMRGHLRPISAAIVSCSDDTGDNSIY